MQRTLLVKASTHQAQQVKCSVNDHFVFRVPVPVVFFYQHMIPEEFLPQYKMVIFSNWCNFDVYSIDFGISKPHLFLPIGESLLPWVSCIVEGFKGKGLLVSAVFPKRVAKQLMQLTRNKPTHIYY